MFELRFVACALSTSIACAAAPRENAAPLVATSQLASEPRERLPARVRCRVRPSKKLRVQDPASISADGSLVVTSSGAGIQFWDAKTCALGTTIAAKDPSNPPRVELIASTHDVLAIDEGGEPLLRLTPNGQARSAAIPDVRWIHSRAISRDGKTLVGGAEEKFPSFGFHVLVVDLDAMKEVRRIPLPTADWVHTATFLPSQKTLVLTTRKVLANGEYEDKVGIIEVDVATWTVRRSFRLDTFRSDNTALAFGADTFVLDDQVVELSTGKLLSSLVWPARPVKSDGRLALVTRDAREYFVWNVDEPLPQAPRFFPFVDSYYFEGAARDGTALFCDAARDACDVVPPL